MNFIMPVLWTKYKCGIKWCKRKLQIFPSRVVEKRKTHIRTSCEFLIAKIYKYIIVYEKEPHGETCEKKFKLNLVLKEDLWELKKVLFW